MAVSDTWLKANHKKVRAKPLEKTDRDGLSARLSPKGKVTFTLRYQYFGKAKRVDIGSYPLISLKKARAESQRLRASLEQGHDPKVVRQLEKKAIVGASSFEALFRQWYETYCKKNKKNHNEILRSFEIHVFPKLGALPAEKITLHAWLSLLEEHAQTRPGITDRILTNAKQVLKWGVKRQMISTNHLSDINAKEDLQIKKGVGTRSLSAEEIRLVWLALEKSRMSAKNKLYIKLCLFYGCRNGELRLSEKSHFDFKEKIWTIPAENHKLGKATGKPLLRPIIPEIEPLIKQAMTLSGDGTILFNNTGTNKPMGRSAPLALPYNIMQWLRRHQKYEMEHWSLHDLRKTARTNLSTLTEPHIAEIMLGHKLPGSWQVYDHYDYLPEQAEAYKGWWDRLVGIVEDRERLESSSMSAL